MRCLVTGGAGFIGSRLVEKLIDYGHEVKIIDCFLNGPKPVHPKAELLKFNLQDLEKTKEAFKGVEIVFHTAAMPRVPLSIEKPLETHNNNVNVTLNVLLAAKETGIKRVIYSASSSAYGYQNKLPLSEEMKPNPLNPYAAQKYMGEVYCKIFTDVYGLETVSLRYFNVYGPGMNFDGAYKTVIAVFLEQMKKGEPLTIAGDGEQSRDFTHVDDVVKANLLAMISKKVGKGEVINIGAGNSKTINEIADLVGGEKKYVEARKNEAQHTLADTGKAEKLLEWMPLIKFETGLKDLVKQYVEQD